MINALLSQLRARQLGTASAALGSLAVASAAPVEVPADGGGVSRVLLMPLGDIVARDGRRFCLPAEAAADVVAASVAYAGNRDIPCDYDHQLVFAVGKGAAGQAPAAGWIKPGSLAVTAAGIEGEVEWTPPALSKLAAREYRYVSPSFTHDKAGRITSIRFLSLVNDNAFDSLPAVATTPQFQSQETSVNYAKIAAALGLPAEASEDDILAAIAGMALPPPAVMTAAAAALGLGEDATPEQIVTAATAAATAEPDPSKFVPIEVVNELQSKLATAAAAGAASEAEQLISTASAEGKLTPAMQGWAKSYAAKDLAGFKTWLATAAVVVAPGQAELDTAAARGGGDTLTESEKKICKLTGVSEEAYLAAKKKGN